MQKTRKRSKDLRRGIKKQSFYFSGVCVPGHCCAAPRPRGLLRHHHPQGLHPLGRRQRQQHAVHAGRVHAHSHQRKKRKSPPRLLSPRLLSPRPLLLASAVSMATCFTGTMNRFFVCFFSFLLPVGVFSGLLPSVHLVPSSVSLLMLTISH